MIAAASTRRSPLALLLVWCSLLVCSVDAMFGVVKSATASAALRGTSGAWGSLLKAGEAALVVAKGVVRSAPPDLSSLMQVDHDHDDEIHNLASMFVSDEL
mmetsp:Transcript_106291/g.307657  ORF Transcript_106291/g.307657 Transcript_106291/m.307657 type:complete len:101 (+) Transcript_106291:88-390(+)|eukprot:CAMPEP_0176018666 /NCGR_PEP_ID=MMETSP0120_2-20121206/8995_1 /TAXON_ID=160619 /ORGANISM="Kryptoperidinium foliaceum, Strain CCMP 1326" /LENGTH=100 /DNA_ID=CAMNT_0017351723 /DNA_START=84 /DNA_END=386 /DNA_ORIENTATION=+